MSEAEKKELWVSVGYISTKNPKDELVSRVVLLHTSAKKSRDEAQAVVDAWIKEEVEGESRAYQIEKVNTAS